MLRGRASLVEWDKSRYIQWKGTTLICNKWFEKPAYIDLNHQVETAAHFIYLQTSTFSSFCCLISAFVRGVVVSSCCANVWLGRAVVYVCQQSREEGGGGYRTPCPVWNMRVGDPRSPFPVFTLSASGSLVIPALLKHLMKARPQINVCAVLFFLWGSNEVLYPPVPLLHSLSLLFCLIPVCFWDATREVIVSGLYYGSLKIGLGHLKGQWELLFFKKSKFLPDIGEET